MDLLSVSVLMAYALRQFGFHHRWYSSDGALLRRLSGLFSRSLRKSLCHLEAISFAFVSLSATNIPVDLVGFSFDNYARAFASFMGFL